MICSAFSETDQNGEGVKTAKKVILERREILQETTPEEYQSELVRFFPEKVRSAFIEVNRISCGKTANFLADLMVAASRVWEAFQKDEEGNYLFLEEWGEDPKLIWSMIYSDWSSVSAALSQSYDKLYLSDLILSHELITRAKLAVKNPFLKPTGNIPYSNPRRPRPIFIITGI
jgi:hypothetical protein